jgi:hypothetical protein
MAGTAPFDYKSDFRTSFDLIKAEPITNFSAFTQQVFDHESSFKGPKILD